MRLELLLQKLKLKIEFDTPEKALNLSAGSGRFNPDIGLKGGFSRDTDFIPIYVPKPRYPSRAEKNGKSRLCRC